MSSVNLIVIAKAPVPGRSKTRLTPPLSPAQASSVAEASLADTLEAVTAAGARRRILALEGEPGAWLPPGFEVVAQAQGGLERRLEAAFAGADAPSILIGMDTPQLSRESLDRASAALLEPGVDATIGAAEDGGYWLVGLHRPIPGAFQGVPMSTRRTFAAQTERFRELGLRWAEVPALRDVDTIEDAVAVAAISPGSRFTAALKAAISGSTRTVEPVSTPLPSTS